MTRLPWLTPVEPGAGDRLVIRGGLRSGLGLGFGRVAGRGLALDEPVGRVVGRGLALDEPVGRVVGRGLALDEPAGRVVGRGLALDEPGDRGGPPDGSAPCGEDGAMAAAGEGVASVPTDDEKRGLPVRAAIPIGTARP